ncbi:MAG: M23 family metallopeptidase [Myxococcota bacterium]
MRRALALCWLLCALPSLAAAEAVDLIGTWYVLVHYKDDNAPNADQERWDDRVWVFAKKGRRIQWTEYPIVVFEDDTGRFERRHTGQYARILHYWEPNVGQRAEIRSGLQVNSRGSKVKTLRGNDDDGWTSSRQMSAASASVVTYQEVWSIEGMPTRPVFRRADMMGGGRTDSMEGLTEYAASEVMRTQISGSYERDGSRHGTFRMFKAGDVGAVKGAKDQKELQEKVFRREMERAVQESPQIQAQARQGVRDGLAESGIYVGRQDVERLGAQVVAWNIQGVPDREIQERIGEQMIADYWSFAPRGAEPDATVRYAFPFDPATPRRLLLGEGGDLASVGTREGPLGQFEHLARHTGFARHSFKFELPVGSEVRAARGGEVARVVDGFKSQQSGVEIEGNPNAVWVLHEDGTAALYLHLSDGIPVRPGDAVKTGDVLGRSGRPGYVETPLLHFGVIRVDDRGEPRSVDIRFEDGSAAGLVPVAGELYPGG